MSAPKIGVSDGIWLDGKNGSKFGSSSQVDYYEKKNWAVPKELNRNRMLKQSKSENWTNRWGRKASLG